MDVLIQKAEAAVGLLMERERAQLDGHFTEDGIGSDRWGWSAPADWQRVPMSSLTTTLFADGDWIESPDITDSGVRLIQTGNIGVGEYREQGYRYIAPETFSKLACTEVLPGDVLLCRLAAPIGRACLAPDLAMRMVTSVDVTILRCRPDVVPEFVVAACSTSGWLQRLDAEGQGGTRSRIARLRLGEMRIPLPGVAQQRHVLEVIARAREETSDAVAALMRQAALLRERRQALITAAVTGELEG